MALCAALCLILPVSGGAEDKLTRYPGASALKSPTGLYAVSSVDKEDVEPAHVLVVRNTRTEKEVARVPYSRYVEVMWSPDGTSLAINNHGGSDHTKCEILSFGQPIRSLDLLKTLRSQINPPSIRINHHVFLECVAWLGNDVVSVTSHGYGEVNPTGFTESYLFSVKERRFKSRVPQ